MVLVWQFGSSREAVDSRAGLDAQLAGGQTSNRIGSHWTPAVTSSPLLLLLPAKPSGLDFYHSSITLTLTVTLVHLPSDYRHRQKTYIHTALCIHLHHTTHMHV